MPFRQGDTEGLFASVWVPWSVQVCPSLYIHTIKNKGYFSLEKSLSALKSFIIYNMTYYDQGDPSRVTEVAD